MDIETVQNIVLIGMAVLTFFMYLTAKAWDEIADEMDAKE